ncbi:hypothetical protein [Arthrobacter roseus]|uniref:hypothetical protein n=1 Tax=Arthrobacter roseus TaxID=136274 RepID=UPI0019668730|nr:hypothetical protein [Arthrobacter roseus]MBM7847493.1 hypothetical protein [Arthrobacter roseus]
MSNEIVPISTGNKVEYAKTLAVSNLLPKHFQNNPANLLFAIEFAEALGMKPIHAITSVHVINGKPSASADLIGAMVRKAGHKLRVTGDDTYAEATLIRVDDPDFEFKARWDMAKAKQANLNTATWKAYPGAMLRSRAIAEVCRAGAPDAMHGIQHSTEELESLGEPTTPAPDSAFTRLTQVEPEADEATGEIVDRDWTAEAKSTTTLDQLHSLYREAQSAGESAGILQGIQKEAARFDQEEA